MSDKQYHEASDTENRNDIVANFDEKPWNCFYGIAADGVLHTSIQYSGETLSRTSFDHEGWCDSAGNAVLPSVFPLPAFYSCQAGRTSDGGNLQTPDEN